MHCRSAREEWYEAWRYARFNRSIDSDMHMFTNVSQYRASFAVTAQMAIKARELLGVRSEHETESSCWVNKIRELRYLAIKVANSWRQGNGPVGVWPRRSGKASLDAALESSANGEQFATCLNGLATAGETCKAAFERFNRSVEKLDEHGDVCYRPKSWEVDHADHRD